MAGDDAPEEKTSRSYGVSTLCTYRNDIGMAQLFKKLEFAHGRDIDAIPRASRRNLEFFDRDFFACIDMASQEDGSESTFTDLLDFLVLGPNGMIVPPCGIAGHGRLYERTAWW